MTGSSLSIVVQALMACQNNTEQALEVLMQQKHLKLLGVEHEGYDDLNMKTDQDLGSDYFKYGLELGTLDDIVHFYEKMSDNLVEERRRL